MGEECAWDGVPQNKQAAAAEAEAEAEVASSGSASKGFLDSPFVVGLLCSLATARYGITHPAASAKKHVSRRRRVYYFV